MFRDTSANGKLRELRERALKLAHEVHSKLVDKTGAPAHKHVLRVAEGAANLVGRTSDKNWLVHYIVGLLHDVVEDSDTTIEYIEKYYGSEIATSVEALTHRPNEPYWKYLDRVAANEIATIVKLADLEDNLDWRRALRVTDDHEFTRVVDVLVPRYLRAYRRLRWKEGVAVYDDLAESDPTT